jgi:hypothetical protein
MKVAYGIHIIESLKGEDGLYHVTIDGQPSGITSKYRVSAINRAIKSCQEQERQQALKELGL